MLTASESRIPDQHPRLVRLPGSAPTAADFADIVQRASNAPGAIVVTTCYSIAGCMANAGLIAEDECTREECDAAKADLDETKAALEHEHATAAELRAETERLTSALKQIRDTQWNVPGGGLVACGMNRVARQALGEVR